MQRTILCSLFLMLILTVSCVTQKNGTTGDAGWLTDPYSEYNEHVYLLAVGSGYSLQEAQNNASANMSMIFSSQVSSDQRLRSRYTDRQTEDDQYFSESTSDLLNITNVRTHQELLNTRVLKTHHDGSQHYVLLGINKLETSMIIGGEIKANDAAIQDMHSIISQSNNKSEQLSYIDRVSILMEVNRNLIAQYSILSEVAYRDHANYNAMLRSYEQIKKGTIFSVLGDDKISASIIAALNDNGYTVSGEAYDYEVISYVDTRKANLNRDDAVFMNWNLNITITSLADNDINTFETGGRSGTLAESDLEGRVYTDINEEIKRSFTNFLNTQLFSLN